MKPGRTTKERERERGAGQKLHVLNSNQHTEAALNAKSNIQIKWNCKNFAYKIQYENFVIKGRGKYF